MAAGPVAAILFDFDGLILDTETAGYVTVAEIFAAHGLELSKQAWVEIIGTADHPHWSEMLEQALGRPLDDKEQLIEARTARKDELTRAEPLRPGVLDLALEARAAGVGVAIASSSSRDWVVGHLERFGIAHHFPVLSTRDDVGARRTKPHPDLFLLAAERVGADPRACVVLEDSEPGVHAANAAGCLSVAVPAGMTGHLPFSHSHHVVASVANIDLDQLDRWMAARTVGR